MKTTANAALFCILSAIFTHAQVDCEQIPHFADRQIILQQCDYASEVSGNVLGADLTRAAVHLSLSAISFNKSFEVAVDQAGTFVFHFVPAGDYELLATQGGRIFGFGKLTVSPGTTHLVFQLSNERPVLQTGPVSTPQIRLRGRGM